MKELVWKLPPPTVKEWKAPKELPPLRPNSRKKSWLEEQRKKEKEEQRRAALEDLRYQKYEELERRRRL